MSKHTKERIAWYTSNSYRRIGTEAGYQEMVYAVKHKDGAASIECIDDDVCKRLIDCWNACAGLNPEGIREAVRVLEHFVYTHPNYHQGDHLLEHRIKKAAAGQDRLALSTLLEGRKALANLKEDPK